MSETKHESRVTPNWSDWDCLWKIRIGLVLREEDCYEMVGKDRPWWTGHGAGGDRRQKLLRGNGFSI